MRLPDDFDVANYALLCQGGQSGWQTQDLSEGRTFGQGVAKGLVLAQEALEGMAPVSGSQHDDALLELTLDLEYGENVITHNLGTTELLVQVLSAEGYEVLVQEQLLSPNELALHSDATHTLKNAKVLLYAGSPRAGGQASCPEVCQLLTTQQKVVLRYQSSFGRRNEFHHLEPLRFMRPAGVAADCRHLYHQARHACWLQGGFLLLNQTQHTPTSGQLLLSYQSVLENEQGELLTLDHPLVNDYYEYALKERIFENLYLAGEDVLQKLQYVQSKLRPAKLEALSLVNTPDFNEFRRLWELNRKAQIHKYYLPIR